jgi:hypothetical protein
MRLLSCKHALCELRDVLQMYEQNRRKTQNRTNVSEELIRAVDHYVRELAESGADVELNRRAAEFEARTSSGSTFDATRKAVSELLNSTLHDLYLPDFSGPTFGTRHRVAEFNADGTLFTLLPDVRYSNYLYKVHHRLKDSSRIFWNCPWPCRTSVASLLWRCRSNNESCSNAGSLHCGS